MLFQKPKDMKYTDMCIYIDNIVARGNPTTEEENKIYEYLYHLSFMLAHKHKYFNKSYYYEEFAMWFATEIIYRLFYNPRLNEIGEDGEPVLSPIKSVLNYMKGIMYGRKVAFEQQTYSQKYSEFEEGNYLYSFNGDPYDSLKESDILLYISQISKTIKNIVYKKNFYKNDKVLMKNIYMSCLLTILNSLTLSERAKDKFENTYSSIDSKYRLLSRLYKENRANGLILYHLDQSMGDYITVLVNKSFKQLKNDLAELSSQSFSLSDSAMNNILFLEINGEGYNKETR